MQQVLKPLLLPWGLLSCFCYCLSAVVLFLLLIQNGLVLCKEMVYHIFGVES